MINDIEVSFSVHPFTDEWETLTKDPARRWRRRYAELAVVERAVPFAIRRSLCRGWSARIVAVSYVADVAAAIRAALPDDMIPDEDAEALFLMYAILVLAKGSRVTREDVHDAWSAWMTWRGETHESLVPFAELSASTKAEDDPYVAAIHRVARRYASNARRR